MQVQIFLDDRLIPSGNTNIIEKQVKEGLIIRGYLNGELSLGEVKEILGFQYIDDAMDWLHEREVATTRELPENLATIEQQNYEKLKASLMS